MNILVVYYSRTGTTRRLAKALARALDADLDEIISPINRRGVLGYLSAGTEASFQLRTRILPANKDPRDYDLVVIGTPVWRMSLSSPVRTYLDDHAWSFKNVAFFCTMDHFGSRRVFRQMQQICRRRPVATLARTADQLSRPDLPVVVQAFAAPLCESRAMFMPAAMRA